MKPNFEDFDEDTGSYDRTEDDQIGGSGQLLRNAIDIIATAPNMPLSATPKINRDEIIDILEGALQSLPDELRQARWMMKERDEFIARTRREADEIIDAVLCSALKSCERLNCGLAKSLKQPMKMLVG
jgi:hypothetical protein